ncbi:MAG: hypothetical protein GX589_07950 [Deltaproteobacteria bacterium]|nr:hypothetical protein [Deltaproteobacteria bacterium]
MTRLLLNAIIALQIVAWSGLARYAWGQEDGAATTSEANPVPLLMPPAPGRVGPPTSTVIVTSTPVLLPNPTRALGQNDTTNTSELELISIDFDYTEDSKLPKIQLTLSSRTKFTLQKLSRKTYVLEIPGCMLKSEHLMLPHYPPQDFKGINMIRSKPTKTGVEIQIAVEKDAKIVAIGQDRQILIMNSAKH